MALDDGNIDVQGAFRDGAEGVISPEMLKQISPAPSFPLYASHCIQDLEFEDGTNAPGEEFHFGVNLEFPNMAAYEKFVEHPDRDEIIYTIYDRAYDGIEDSFRRELERDEDPGTIERGESGYNTLTPNTVGDLELSLGDVFPEINAIYDIEISGANVPSRSSQVQGCSGPVEIDENGHAIAGLDTKGSSLIPGGGM